jgi:ABC-2 type transport system ATP-binding protein
MTDEVIGVMDLAERADDFVKTYSGGMRRRLELAQALVHDPEVLFLDEPTVGLDVAARRKIWDHIRSLKKKGMTVFVTTHYMDEADRNCNRIAFIDHGKMRKCDTPDSLKSIIAGDIIVASMKGSFSYQEIPEIRFIGQQEDEITFVAQDGQIASEVIRREVLSQGLTLHSLYVRKPTLDDVFLHLVDNNEDTGPINMSRFRNMMGRRR